MLLYCHNFLQGFTSTPTPLPILTLTKVQLKQIIKTYIEQAQNHPRGLRGKSDWLLKPHNFDL